MRVCVRCGKELTKHQKKYCCVCGHEVMHERMRKRAQEKRERGVTAARSSCKKKPEENDHMIWEANICLNCTRGRCVNCLEYKTQKEKEELLEKSGGRKWAD